LQFGKFKTNWIRTIFHKNLITFILKELPDNSLFIYLDQVGVVEASLLKSSEVAYWYLTITALPLTTIIISTSNYRNINNVQYNINNNNQRNCFYY